MAAKEKSSSRLTAWFAPLLILLAVAAAVPAPASASMAGALETRAWEKTSAPLESRPLESLQLLNLHQQNGGAGYDDALASPLAAESTPALPEGSFSIRDWSGYPQGAPQPEGPFRLLEGEEYETARDAANAANKAIHDADPSLAGQHIHEIQPVKFGGSPTDPANKIPLSPQAHQPFTNWWNALMRSING